MYGLRGMTNHYAQFAGARSDFVILSHPEYNRGKYGCENGIGPGWTATDPKTRHPGKSWTSEKLKGSMLRRSRSSPSSPAGAELMQSGQMSLASTGSDWRRSIVASNDGEEERRQMQLPCKTLSPQQVQDAMAPKRSVVKRAVHPKYGAPGVEGTLDQFITHLNQPDGLPAFSREHRTGDVTRHDMDARAQLSDLRERMRRDPDQVRRELQATGHWKAYAQLMGRLGTRRVWGEDLVDGYHPRASGATAGLGRFKYTVPDSALQYMEDPLARPIPEKYGHHGTGQVGGATIMQPEFNRSAPMA